jgi:hypothetical protein
VGEETLPTGQKRYVYADFNRFLNDIWLMTKPSAIKGGLVGHLLSSGIGPGGFKAISKTLSVASGLYVGSKLAEPVNLKARDFAALRHEHNLMFPELQGIWHKLSPTLKVMIQTIANTHMFYGEKIIDEHMTPEEQLKHWAAFTAIEMTPFSRNPLDPAEFRAFANGSIPEIRTKAMGMFASKGDTLVNWQRKLQKIDIDFTYAKRKIATDHRRYPTAALKRKAIEKEVKKYLRVKNKMVKTYKNYIKGTEGLRG